MKHKCAHQGFTLIEILIALLIFSIVAVIVTRGLNTVLTLQAASQKKSDQFSKIQLAMIFLSNDLTQIINRPVTNAKNMLENSVLGSSHQVTFTRGGLVNPAWQLTQSTLQRVRYRLENETLWRDTWTSLDQTSHSAPESRPLLKNVKELRFQYLDKQNKFHDRWPIESTSASPPLPRAIQVFFSLKKSGTIKQTYITSGQSFENSTPQTSTQ